MNSWETIVLGILFNCSEPEAITLALQHLHHGKVRDDNDNTSPLSSSHVSSSSPIIQRLKNEGIVLGAYANRLTPIEDDTDWTLAESEAAQPMRNDLSEKDYWDKFISIWIHIYNIKIVGGCCGIKPSHIKYIRSQI